MTPILQRKTVPFLTLAASLAVTLIILARDEHRREQLGTRYWLLGLAIIGSVLMLLTGYVWGRTTVARLREIKRSAGTPASEFTAEPETHIDADTDEIMGLARHIERVARSLQKVEASYRAVVEDQVDLICRYRADGTLTFVNSACVQFFGGKRPDHLGQRLPLISLGCPRRDYQGAFAASQEFEVGLKNTKGQTAHNAWMHRASTGREGEIRDLSRIEAGAIEIESAPFALRDCLQEIEYYFRLRAITAGLRFDTRTDPGFPVILNGDQGQLRQTLFHLVGKP